MMKLAPWSLLLLAATCWPAAAQSWDTSGNSRLNGTYYFREVFYVVGDGYGDLSDAVALYGTATFDGNGNSTMNATEYDYYGSQSGTLSGTYSIAASGYGFLSNPLSSGDSVYGLVSAQGIFVGSSTESGFNDVFVAAPVSTQTSLATFKGSYTIAGIDLSGFYPQYSIGTMFQLNPDGAGNLGNITVSGYAGGGGSTRYTQTLSRVGYNLSNNAFNLQIPNVSSGLISGQKFFYISPDGNFVFGGSPAAVDFFVGVRTGTDSPNFGGLYYQTGLDQPVDGNGIGYLDTYYGALNGGGGVLLGHQRLADSFNGTYDYTYGDSYSVNSNGTYGNSFMNYAVGAGGAIRIGSGIGPYLGLNVALAAPSLSGDGVFLNPEGVVNAGSWAPFTAGIAPGEFVALVGTGLAPDGLPVSSTIPFPTTVGPVQVKINDVPAPIYYATPNLIEAIVPYGITGSMAQIQVINNGVTSNTVTSFLNLTAPGVFTQTQNGLGHGAIQHSDFSLVTPDNPAHPGETLLVYLTGLGAVNPAVNDGDAAPGDAQTNTASTITAAIGGQSATVSFAGLTPGAVALYQVNVVVPSNATSGDNLLAISGPDSYSAEATIPVQ